jgi:hypothetical protein
VAPEACELTDVESQRVSRASIVGGIRHELVKESDFPSGQHGLRGSIRVGAMGQGQPEDPPSDNAEQREEVGNPLGGAKAALLRAAA